MYIGLLTWTAMWLMFSTDANHFECVLCFLKVTIVGVNIDQISISNCFRLRVFINHEQSLLNLPLTVLLSCYN